jgi:hypothetical protein
MPYLPGRAYRRLRRLKLITVSVAGALMVLVIIFLWVVVSQGSSAGFSGRASNEPQESRGITQQIEPVHPGPRPPR